MTHVQVHAAGMPHNLHTTLSLAELHEPRRERHARSHATPPRTETVECLSRASQHYLFTVSPWAQKLRTMSGLSAVPLTVQDQEGHCPFDSCGGSCRRMSSSRRLALSRANSVETSCTPRMMTRPTTGRCLGVEEDCHLERRPGEDDHCCRKTRRFDSSCTPHMLTRHPSSIQATSEAGVATTME